MYVRKREVFACTLDVKLPSYLRDCGSTAKVQALCTVSAGLRSERPVFEKVELTMPESQGDPRSGLLTYVKVGNTEATTLMLGIIDAAYRAYDQAQEAKDKQLMRYA